ncbi:MAG: hypothetical protein COC15_01925 [Legionellales bacterium]|nr:MAG: hypothetical protein COC15_01925 [Legionellales bacterium]
MRGLQDEILYIGKAKNLKKRVTAYFKDPNKLDKKTAALVGQIVNIHFEITNNEQEALLLEQKLIKKLQPKYNILLRDDKSFPYIMISNDKYSSITMHRGAKQQANKYYGPFANIAAVRSSLEVLHKVFLLRQCSNAVFKSRSRPCLQYQIKRCSAPCVNYISVADYNVNIKNAAMFLRGKLQLVLTNLQDDMAQAAAVQDFVRAAMLRDQIAALHPVITRNNAWQHNNTLSGLAACKQLQEALQLPQLQRIECFDVSHTSGELTVASCVVFNQVGPAKAQYRKFNINSAIVGDDCAALTEAIQRRYSRLLQENLSLPDIVVIDGGKAQMAVAVRVLAQLNISSIVILGVTKGLGRKAQFDTVYLANGIILDVGVEAWQWIQYIRDEAHRFAITAHRKRRNKRAVRSILEDIPGVGSVRRHALLQHFGGIVALKTASIKDIMAVPGINRILGTVIYNFLHRD